MENVTEEFLELYRRLEGAIRVKYGDEVGESPVWWMAHKARGYRGMREELDYCREVRNVLQHRQRLEGDFAVVPSKGMVAALRRIVEKVERLPSAYDLSTKAPDLYAAAPHDRMAPVMQAMRERGHSQVPILANGRVVGVLSERTLVAHLMSEGAAKMGEDTTLDCVADLLPLDAHGSESYAFAARDTLATDVAAMFQDALKRKERLSAVFVTQTGRPTERVLGMLTAWDMASYF